LPKATTQTKTKPTKVKDDVTSERRKASLNFEIHNPYFDYEIPQIYKHNNAVLSFGNKEYEKQAKAYSEAIKGLYQSACKASAKAVQRSAKLANFVNSETFANSMLNYFIESYRKEFIEKLPSVVNGNVLSLYQTSRTDQSIFRKRTKQKFVSFAEPLPDIPLPFFSLNDYKLIEYLQGLDLFYLGKFITDEDSIKRFMIALETFYGESAGDIGKDSETIKELGNMFLNETENQTYKIRRIVETTLNKIRNYSSLYYMEQAEVQRFRIVEAMDNLTCPHCQAMNSRIFEVKTATQKIKQETNVPYSEIGNVSPFLTTQKVDDISKLSSSELQSLGYSTPPYHPLCRGIVVADI
jgi:SPP1 gp7 family putative phage head morphogenesis protein